MKNNIYFIVLLFIVIQASAQDVSQFSQTIKDFKTLNIHGACATCESPALSHEKLSLLTDTNAEKLELSVLSLNEANTLVREFLSNKTIPFDYALDGCFARAHKMAYLMEEKGIISGKAFVMGQLYANTKYGPVRWRYHVSPVVLVKVNEKIVPYIIDPALFDHAIPYEEWRNLITGVNPNSPKPSKARYIEYYTNRFIYDPTNAKTKLTEFQPGDLADADAALARYQEIKEKLDATR